MTESMILPLLREMRTDMNELRSDMNRQFEELRTELRDQIERRLSVEQRR